MREDREIVMERGEEGGIGVVAMLVDGNLVELMVALV